MSTITFDSFNLSLMSKSMNLSKSFQTLEGQCMHLADAFIQNNSQCIKYIWDFIIMHVH